MFLIQHGEPKNAGFSYLLVLVMVVMLSVVASASISTGVKVNKRNAEAELLTVGAEYARALASYRALTPNGQIPFPREFGDLLLDKRHPGVVRHLRRLYFDPISGSGIWGFHRIESGHIVGIFSYARGVPIKQNNFDSPFQTFEQAATYRDWCFCTEANITTLRSDPAGFNKVSAEINR